MTKSSKLLDRFPGLARYVPPSKTEDLPPREVPPAQPDDYARHYLYALEKTDDAARNRYAAAFMAGGNFLDWARDERGGDYAEYIERGLRVEESWRQRVPLDEFDNRLREWAASYLHLARLCHLAQIDDINREIAARRPAVRVPEEPRVAGKPESLPPGVH